MTDAAPTNIFIGRPDTMLGICEAVGNDLGFNPNWLRAALGLTLLFQPVIVLSTYLAMGVAVMASRLLFPAPQPVAQPAAQVVELSVAAPRTAAETPELALAA